MKHTTLTAILAIFLLAAGAAFGAGMSVGAGSVDFVAGGPGELTVSGPDGFEYRAYLKTGSGSMSLFDAEGAYFADGAYSWQITLDGQAPAERSGVAVKGETVSGTFTLAGGSVANPNAVEGGFNKDQVFLDDLIVDGSACIGMDCANGESFGFDTLRLKENNLRIKFDDTSASASFPGNDWQITANESDNGGLNKFSIDDITGGKTPFTVEAGAPNHSLYVDDAGNIGVGTNSPVVEVHIKDGDSPTLRLEQDGSSGFTSQTWDLAGNETNFFVRDVTGGSKLPFRIKPGAPTDALFVNSDGNVGLGTDSPAEELHVKRSSGNAAVRLETTESTGADWILRAQTNGSFQIRDDNAATIPVRVGPAAQSDLLNIGMSADGTVADADRINVTGELYVNGDAVACIDSGGQLCACGSCP